MAEKESLAHSIGLVQVNTDVAIDEIAFDILYAFHKPNPRSHADELKEFEASLPTDLTKEKKKAALEDMSNFTEEAMNKKIEALFEQWTNGAKWMENNDKVKSTLLLGPPGQGKTTSFKEASKKVAAALGLNYLLNPSDEVPVTKKDFMFFSQECSGENQSTTFAGIPVKVTDENGIEYMSKLMNKRFALARSAGGSLLLLDDFPNAAPAIQNIGLSLTDEKRFQGLNLDNVYIGLTGNLGSLDGTHTTRLSTALRGRCKIYYTEDELPNWITRVQQKYRDEIGDAGIVGFMQREPQYFAQMPNTKHQGGFASPRTWDHFLQEARRAIVECGGKSGGAQKAIIKIQRLASSMLGPEVGLKVHSYYHSLMLGADPIAKKMIQDGTFDKKAFEERHGDGYSADNQYFAYQFAVALADYAVQDIVGGKNYSVDLSKNTKLKQTMERFGKGILAVGDDTFSFAIDHFKAKLANQIDEWSHPIDKRKVLHIEVKKVLAKIISECPDFTEDKRRVLIDALSDADKYNVSQKRRSAK